MYTIFRTKSFKKQYKKLTPKEKESTKQIITLLANKATLPAKYKDHQLQGDLKDFRECHIKPDLLLIYKKIDDTLELALIQIGTHSALFR
jgi:mRNA interferase YafQ